MKKMLILTSLICLLAACSRETASLPTVPPPPALLEIFRAVPAEGATNSLPELHRRAAPGDTVRFAAKVMGAKTPFVGGRALMVVGDEAVLVSCDLMPGDDQCETPWDACCAPREDFQSGTATVQVVDTEGQVLPFDLRGINGLKELSRVRVEGSVAPISSPGALVVNATAIEVLP